MSRHFNYELDEHRIKVLLSENSMSFSEDVWNEFMVKTKPIERASKLPNFNFNFAINRSVLLTGVFIILIGSFTLLIARFVDFNATKSNTETLREVKPDANNFKLEKMAASLPRKESASVAAKPTPTVAEQTMTLNTVTVPTNTVQQYASVPTNTYTQNSNSSSSESSMMARNNPDTVSNAKDSTSVTQSPVNNQPRRFKKKKKEVEPMETKPLTTGLPNLNTEEQPEPELKID
jgi:hypothetical protein